MSRLAVLATVFLATATAAAGVGFAAAKWVWSAWQLDINDVFDD